MHRRTMNWLYSLLYTSSEEQRASTPASAASASAAHGASAVAAADPRPVELSAIPALAAGEPAIALISSWAVSYKTDAGAETGADQLCKARRSVCNLSITVYMLLRQSLYIYLLRWAINMLAAVTARSVRLFELEGERW